VTQLSSQLRDWLSDLDDSLRLATDSSPAVYNLHFEYSLAQILLNRPNAGFGIDARASAGISATSRHTCVHHAEKIAHHLAAYRNQYGSTSTMLGSALYTITIASTTLIADIVEQKSGGQAPNSACLWMCICCLKEMEKSEIVAKRVRKILQSVMRLCELDDQPERYKGADNFLDSLSMDGVLGLDFVPPRRQSILPDLEDSSFRYMASSQNDAFMTEDFLQTTAQADLLGNFETWFDLAGRDRDNAIL